MFETIELVEYVTIWVLCLAVLVSPVVLLVALAHWFLAAPPLKVPGEAAAATAPMAVRLATLGAPLLTGVVAAAEAAGRERRETASIAVFLVSFALLPAVLALRSSTRRRLFTGIGIALGLTWTAVAARWSGHLVAPLAYLAGFVWWTHAPTTSLDHLPRAHVAG